ncbi:hypothetical protein E1B28_008276 [Marasmius oreades]|uniref:mRNA export factor GLE1 n=1 Tax=Marasmius oreades TaxID=181124 RepID=A0A9P7RY66_9AGAR|nr:uncharacterized protein E1B28_008276 [Marasmius oreades]KAG7091875.1 hypothetical protein E1B28_008276 [Marasmius oreades]
MRFSAPRSLSPSPVRQSRRKSTRRSSNPKRVRVEPPIQKRHSSTFGIVSDDEDESTDSYDSESESYTGSDSGEESVPGSSDSNSDSDSFCYGSESEVPRPLRNESLSSSRTNREQKYIEETISAIRLRARHYDPYEEWEKETRKESLRVARKEHATSQSKLHTSQATRHTQETERLAFLLTRQETDVNNFLEKFRFQQQQQEAKLREQWDVRNKFLWDRVEKGIKLDQDKAHAKWDEERRKKEAEEKRRKEEEERVRREEVQRRLEEEKKKQEEEEELKRKEEERQRKEEEERKEREDREQREKETKERTERLKTEESARKQARMTTPEEDWLTARQHLHIAKSQGTRVVKNDPGMKPRYLAGRRQIVPKIGQVTNDPESIARVSAQLVQILLPTHGSPVYNALLSALAKCFILQAETEVTAEKRSVEPLAKVAFNCLDALQGFPEVFFAKIVQRVGGWAIPIYARSLPPMDHDGRVWKDVQERKKVIGYREGESESEYSDRVMGVMRLYFATLKVVPRERPLSGMWRMTRAWVWMARAVGEREVLESPIGAGVLHVVLETLGSDAKQIWGVQFVKLLALLYQGSTKGLENGKLLGGDSPEGIGARSRVRLEIESIMSGTA